MSANAQSKERRIINLQQQVRIARDALNRIADGRTRDAAKVAEAALDSMWPLDPKQPLQGIVGHQQRARP